MYLLFGLIPYDNISIYVNIYLYVYIYIYAHDFIYEIIYGHALGRTLLWTFWIIAHIDIRDYEHAYDHVYGHTNMFTNMFTKRGAMTQRGTARHGSATFRERVRIWQHARIRQLQGSRTSGWTRDPRPSHYTRFI